jgi:phage gpG-like protein
MSVKFEEKRQKLDDLLEDHLFLKNHEAVIGIMGNKASEIHKGDENPIQVVLVASVHEFGSTTVPERSFLRSAMDSNKTSIAKYLENAYISILNGKDAKKSLGKLGEIALSYVYQQFDRGGDPKWPDLKESTVEQRKDQSSKPLMDTGQLRQSLQTAVRKRGSST